MRIEDAVRLIQNKAMGNAAASWADLGCGSGVFTYALARLLAPGSTIAAIDRDRFLLQPVAGITINQHQLDFVNEPLPLQELDGILMANSLHYVKNKPGFLQKIKSLLSRNASLLIVEYDTLAGNSWVPYPVDFLSLQELMTSQGFGATIKLRDRPSAFGKKNMYAALVSQ